MTASPAPAVPVAASAPTASAPNPGPATGSARARRAQVDLRLAPAAVAVWVTACLALTAPADLDLWGGGCLLLVGLVMLGTPIRRPWTLAVVALTCCVGGAAVAAGCRLAALRGGPVAHLAAARRTVVADIVVGGDPERREGRPGRHGPPFVMFAATMTRLEAGGRALRVRAPVTVLATGDHWLGLLPSTRLRMTARLAPGHRNAPVAALAAARGSPMILAGPKPHQRVAGYLRHGLRRAAADLPEPERGLLPALVDGDTSDMPSALQEDFRVTGLVHIDAVSGENLTILLGVVLTTARWVGLRGRAVPLIGAATVAAFVVVARPQPSVLRAAVMGALVLLAMATGRRRQGLAALCAAVLVLVEMDPWLARSYGFALSSLATAGLLVLAPGWRVRLVARGVPPRLAEAIAVPAAAQVACDPVLVMLSARLSVVAVPANLLAEVAVGPVTVVGVVVMALAPVSMSLAHLVAWLGFPPAWWIVTVARRLARVPAATVAWPSTFVGAIGLAAATTTLVIVGPRLLRRPGWLAAVLAVALCALFRPGLPSPWPPAGWRLVACDVGQGDALALATGPGSAVVVDAGPDPVAVDGCLRALGVHRVPVLVLTHFHADHVEGLPGVLRGRVVGQIKVTQFADPAPEVGRVRHWASVARVPVSATQAGERYVNEAVSWRVLWPRPGEAAAWADPNDASVVLDVNAGGLRVLLTGDIEPSAQQALLAAEPGLRADVLKVPHHGSAHQDAELIRSVAPRLALVSVGAGNTYGHPAARTMSLLRRIGARTLRTDVDGAVAVVGDAARLRVAGRKGAGVPPLQGAAPANRVAVGVELAAALTGRGGVTSLPGWLTTTLRFRSRPSRSWSGPRIYSPTGRSPPWSPPRARGTTAPTCVISPRARSPPAR